VRALAATLPVFRTVIVAIAVRPWTIAFVGSGGDGVIVNFWTAIVTLAGTTVTTLVAVSF
jgi:hypothetical protein